LCTDYTGIPQPEKQHGKIEKAQNSLLVRNLGAIIDCGFLRRNIESIPGGFLREFRGGHRIDGGRIRNLRNFREQESFTDGFATALKTDSKENNY
jgi:hypothetical protein